MLDQSGIPAEEIAAAALQHDARLVALKAIKAGEMEASMAQNPARMGSEGVDLAVKVVNGETVPEFIPIDGVLITQDNVDQFLVE